MKNDVSPEFERAIHAFSALVGVTLVASEAARAAACAASKDSRPRRKTWLALATMFEERALELRALLEGKLAIQFAMDTCKLYVAARALPVSDHDLLSMVTRNIEEYVAEIQADEADLKRIGLSSDELQSRAIAKIAIFGINMAEAIAKHRPRIAPYRQ